MGRYLDVSRAIRASLDDPSVPTTGCDISDISDKRSIPGNCDISDKRVAEGERNEPRAALSPVLLTEPYPVPPGREWLADPWYGLRRRKLPLPAPPLATSSRPDALDARTDDSHE